MLTFSLIDAVSSLFNREPNLDNSDEYGLDIEYFPVYVPVKEWDNSYDVKVYMLQLFKHKDTEERRFQEHSYISPTTETNFDKEDIEAYNKISFGLIDKSFPAVSGHALKEETLPNKIQAELQNSPLFES